MITAGQLLDFILEHRTNKVFKGYSKEEVAGAVRQGIENGTLFYSESEGRVTGMILAEKLENNVLFVTQNLAMNLKTLMVFARMAQERFPGMRLEAIRHDTHRHFNTPKLYKKLGA